MEKGNKLIHIAITGPESTGKTTLAKSLAEHFNTVWVPEYVREYFEIHGSDYAYDDLEKIAKGQIELETKLEKKANRFLFADTEMLVMKIWSEYKYGKCSPWILKTIETHRYDLYLLCNTDLPWEYDPLREAPSKEERNKLFDLYLREIKNYGFPYHIVSGTGEKRIKQVIEVLNKFSTIVR